MPDYEKLKVPDLKKLLSERSLTVSGNKAELVARLQESDSKKAVGGTQAFPMFNCASNTFTHGLLPETDVLLQAKMRSTGMKMIPRLRPHLQR